MQSLIVKDLWSACDESFLIVFIVFIALNSSSDEQRKSENFQKKKKIIEKDNGAILEAQVRLKLPQCFLANFAKFPPKALKVTCEKICHRIHSEKKKDEKLEKLILSGC